MLADQRVRFPDVMGFVLGRMSRWPRRVLDGFGYVAYLITYRVLRWRRRAGVRDACDCWGCWEGMGSP